jgi:hypothetical protein
VGKTFPTPNHIHGQQPMLKSLKWKHQRYKSTRCMTPKKPRVRCNHSISDWHILLYLSEFSQGFSATIEYALVIFSLCTTISYTSQNHLVTCLLLHSANFHSYGHLPSVHIDTRKVTYIPWYPHHSTTFLA